MEKIELELMGVKKNGYYWCMRITKLLLNSVTYTTKKEAINGLIGNKIKWNIIEDQRVVNKK